MTTPIIILILKALEGRGAERMVTTLARAYTQLGYRVHVLGLEYTKDMPLDLDTPYHVVPYHEPMLPQEWAQKEITYQQLAQRIDHYVLTHIGVPDMVLVSIYKMNWIMSYSRLPNITNVLHTALSKQFEAQLLTQPEQTIAHIQSVYGAHPCSCVSEGARQDLVMLAGETAPTTTIYNPCDVQQISLAADQPLPLNDFNIYSGQYIIHVGSFDIMKNHHDLLHAYARTNSHYALVLVGQGRLETDIKQLAVELGIDKQVRFLGFQSNPYPLIKQAALLVLCSTFEGFGYVIVEAQALGVAVISTDCPFGPRELLPASSLVAVGDIDGLTLLMNKALADRKSYIVPFNQQLLPCHIAQHYLSFNKTNQNFMQNTL